MAKKVKDFEKQKLKVGKSKPLKSNATSTSFGTKSLVIQSQNKGHDLSSFLALARHYHAPTRRQAVGNISGIIHLHEQEIGEILETVCPLILDEDHQVRIAVSGFLGNLPAASLQSHIKLILVHIHASMTHITPAIRADSTQFLQVLMKHCPEQFVRVGFTSTLALYFPLLGWNLQGNSQSSSVSSTLALGKLASKARTLHINTLNKLIQLGTASDEAQVDILFHLDSEKFMIPTINPFEEGSQITEDSEARKEALRIYYKPLINGLEIVQKEGGEIGRASSKILTYLQAEFDIKHTNNMNSAVMRPKETV